MFFRKSQASQTIIEQDEETTHRPAQNEPRWWRRAWLREQKPRYAETRAYLRPIDDNDPHELWKLNGQ